MVEFNLYKTIVTHSLVIYLMSMRCLRLHRRVLLNHQTNRLMAVWLRHRHKRDYD